MQQAPPHTTTTTTPLGRGLTMVSMERSASGTDLQPGMTVVTAGCASENCSAAAASDTPHSAHTASSLRVRAMISSLASS